MKNDGGAAFPLENSGDGRWVNSGMALRDWFAGMALIGHLSNPETMNHPSYTRDGLVTECYQMADAMLEARGK